MHAVKININKRRVLNADKKGDYYEKKNCINDACGNGGSFRCRMRK